MKLGKKKMDIVIAPIVEEAEGVVHIRVGNTNQEPTQQIHSNQFRNRETLKKPIQFIDYAYAMFMEGCNPSYFNEMLMSSNSVQWLFIGNQQSLQDDYRFVWIKASSTLLEAQIHGIFGCVFMWVLD